MGDSTDPVDRISFLARSEARVEILERLLRSGPATRRDLREDLDASRSTVARSLNALEELDWVRQESNTYRLSPAGELVTAEFLELAETIRTTEELSGFASWFPFSEFDLELELLRDADVTVHSGGDPYAPGRAQNEFVRAADRFRGALPSIDLEGTKLAHERVLAGELETELVVSEAVERTIVSGEYAALFREKLATGRSTVLVSEELFPFYLGLSDDGTVQLGVEDDDGFPRALLESSSTPIREWAEDLYADYRSEARPLTAGAFE